MKYKFNLLALAVALIVISGGGPVVASDCTKTSYPGIVASDYVRSAAHTDAGLLAKAEIVHRDAAGNPSAAGKIALLTIGMSNCKVVADAVYNAHKNDPLKFPGSIIVNGCFNGQTANNFANPNDPVWADVASAVAYRGLTNLQVQAVWIVMTQKEPLTYGAMTEFQLRDDIAYNVKAKYPNVVVGLLSPLTYMGYSDDGVNSTRLPEPYVHDDSIMMASIVEAGGWPFYVMFHDQWSNGLIANSRTGQTWACTDVLADGIHPSDSGKRKLRDLFLTRTKADPVFTGWLWQ